MVWKVVHRLLILIEEANEDLWMNKYLSWTSRIHRLFGLEKRCRV